MWRFNEALYWPFLAHSFRFGRKRSNFLVHPIMALVLPSSSPQSPIKCGDVYWVCNITSASSSIYNEIMILSKFNFPFDWTAYYEWRKRWRRPSDEGWVEEREIHLPWRDIRLYFLAFYCHEKHHVVRSPNMLVQSQTEAHFSQIGLSTSSVIFIFFWLHDFSVEEEMS